jgi:hypothetical protein
MNLYQPTITGSLAVSGSVIINGPMTVVSGSLSGTASLASTASSADNFLVRNTLTAQTLVVQTVTSSVIYSSGSNVFGNNIVNTQIMTGSVNITGSLAVITNGTELQVGATGVNLGNALTDSHIISGSLRVNPSGLFVSSSGFVGIGTVTPTSSLDIRVAVESPATGRVALAAGTSNGANDIFRWFDGTTQLGVFKNSGDISIGTTTTNTNTKVKIKASSEGSGIGLSSSTLSIVRAATDTFLSIGYYSTPDAFVLSTSYGADGAYKPIAFATSDTERMRINTSGEVGIGVTPTSGNRFWVRGNDSTSGNTSLITQNSAGTITFLIRNDGLVQTGTASGSPYNNTSGAAANVVVNSAGTLERSTSSIKYKKEVRDYDKGLAEVMAMRPVYYKGKSESDGEKQFAGLIAEEIHDLGLTEFVQYAEDGTPDALAYQNMIALLTKAIQELKADNDAIRAELAALKS